MSEVAPAIGIDLGTTNSCAAVVKDGKIVLIPGDDGRNVTPSVVYFTNSGSRFVGNLAKEKASQDPKNAIFGTKRFIGRKYEEFKNEKCLSMFPYKVINENNKPHITIKNTVKTYHPEEISAMILSKLKERAEEVLGKKVTKVVITVPAHFNGTQRKATIDAGKLAGLQVLRIINEPTAAVLAFEIDNKYKNRSCNVLVYDFGGGTFDVSIATIHNTDIAIKASNGEAYLGGDDLNNNLIDYFIQHFYKENKVHLNNTSNQFVRLSKLAEDTKIFLSSGYDFMAELAAIQDDLDFECNVLRSTFQQINKDLFDKTLKCIDETLKDAKMNKEDIDEILLVGGSTRIPYVKEIVKDYFNKEPNVSIHPDEAVAIGAARQAAITDTEMLNCEALTAVKLTDVCSLSLGTNKIGGLMSVVIPRNTRLPASETKTYITIKDNQKNVDIDIYEGERPLYADNKLLTTFKLCGLRSAPKGEVALNVTLKIDENGILNVYAIEKGSTNSKQIDVSIYSNNLSNEEIKNMVESAEKFKEDDRIKKEIAILRNSLVDKHYDLNMKLNKITNSTEKARVQKIYDEIAEWLRKNKNSTSDDIQTKINDIEKLI